MVRICGWRRTIGLFHQAFIFADFFSSTGSVSVLKHARNERGRINLQLSYVLSGASTRTLAAQAQPESTDELDMDEDLPGAEMLGSTEMLLRIATANKLELLDGKKTLSKNSIPLKKDRRRIMYSRLITRCLKGLGPEFALPIFRKMVQAGVEADVVSYTMIIKSLVDMTNEVEAPKTTGGGGKQAKMEYANMAVEFLREMREKNITPNGLTYKPIMSWLAACGDERRFEQLLGWMKEDSVNFDATFKSYEIKLCIRNGCVDKAQALIEAAKSDNLELPSSVHAWWMQALASRDRVEELIDVLSEVSSQVSCGKAFTAAFHCLGRFGYEEEAVEHLHVLKQRTGESEPQVPDLIAAYIAGVTNSKDLDKALAAFRRMEQVIRPIMVGVAAYNVLIDTACKQGLLSQGFHLLEEMQQNGLELSAYSFNPFIQEFCRKMRLDDALDAVKHMQRIGVQPSDVIYNSLIHASVKADNMEMAYNLLAEMKQQGIRPTAYSYNPLISGFGKKGLLKRALSVQGEMAADGVEPDAATFSVLLHACSYKKDEKRALKLLKDMESRGIKPTKYVLASMVNVLVRSGNLDRAITLVKQVESEGQKLGIEIKSVLLTGMAAIGRIQDTLALYEKMKTEKLQPDSYAIGMILGMLGTAGDLDRMFAVFEETKSLERYPQLSPGFTGELSKNCVRILVACVRHNQLERAVKFLKKVKAEGIADESVLFDKIFLDISTGGKDEDDKRWANNVDDGFAMIEVMRQMNLQPTRLALEALLDGCAATKDSRRVPEVVREMEREGLPLNIFSRIRVFHAFVAGNDSSGALDALEKMPKDEFRDTDVRMFLYKILQPHYEAAAESPEKATRSETLPSVRRRIDELAGGRTVNLLETML